MPSHTFGIKNRNAGKFVGGERESRLGEGSLLQEHSGNKEKGEGLMKDLEKRKGG